MIYNTTNKLVYLLMLMGFHCYFHEQHTKKSYYFPVVVFAVGGGSSGTHVSAATTEDLMAASNMQVCIIHKFAILKNAMCI